MAKVINGNEFYENIKNIDGLVVVDFSATWWGPCKGLNKLFDEISNKIGDKAKFFKVDIDENFDVIKKYRLAGVPTIIIFKDGVPVENLAGFIKEESITNKVNAYLEKAIV